MTEYLSGSLCRDDLMAGEGCADKENIEQRPRYASREIEARHDQA